jgi:hypothetical protein
MRKLIWTAYALPLAALFASEGAFYLSNWSHWRRYTGLSWIIISVFVLATALAGSLRPLFTRQFWAAPGRGWYLAAFFLLPALVLFDAGGTAFTTIDLEGVQQLGSARVLLHSDPNLGILTVAYTRYMARQFILNYLPSYFFGPSLWALRIGCSMFYLASYAFFLSALEAYFRERKVVDALLFASFCAIMVGFGQYALLNARKFEQAMMPVGCMLFFIGALIYFALRPGPLRFLWLTWSFGFFTGCYTPGIAGWVLALSILGYLVVWKRQWVLIPTIVYGIVCLCVVYLVMHKTSPAILREEFTIGTGEHFSARDWTIRFLQGIRAVAGADYTLLAAPVAIAAAAAMYLSWRFREWRFAVVCAWAAAVAFLSIILFGSAFAYPSRDIERSLVVVPPLVVGAALLILRYMSTASEAGAAGPVRFLMKLSMGYMVFTGIFTVLLVRNFFGPPMPNDEDEVYGMINSLVNSAEVRPTKFYVVPPMNMDIRIGLRYFAPDATVTFGRPPAGEKLPGVYVISYLKRNPADRFDDEIAASRHPRPFIKLERE